ncbi:MAG: transporter [Colwellia sp.]|nr:MAG: transporter [Colwellia sp.]
MKKANTLLNNIVVLTTFLAVFTASHSYAVQQPLSFKKAIQVAQKNDPWLDGSRHKQQSLVLLSYAANTLPDPKVSLAFANLPTNGFDFSQEGMTQFKVGVSQIFARGDSLNLKNKQLKLQSQQQPLQRQDRVNKIAVTVGSLWLDLYRVQQSIALIEKNRSLFEQLAQVAEASYGSALGKTRQQDIVRAQLELTRLEDKLNQLQQQDDRYQGMLEQWLTNFSLTSQHNQAELGASIIPSPLNVSKQLPQVDLINHARVYHEQKLSVEKLAALFSLHPLVKSIDKKIAATKTEIELAEQKYQPQWGVNASYGYRGDDAMGNSRADLFSVGVNFDVPLFTENRQDNEVKSAISKTEVIKTEKLLLVRKLMSAFASAKGQLVRLTQRQTLYNEKLLPQIHDQAEASLTAYTNDDGDFAEVVRARIAELNAEIDFLAINVQKQKIILEINYLLVGSVITQQSGEQ